MSNHPTLLRVGLGYHDARRVSLSRQTNSPARIIPLEGGFPGYQKRLVWQREEFGGNWYSCDDPPMEGRLCPALFRYFDEAPRVLFVKAEAMQR